MSLGRCVIPRVDYDIEGEEEKSVYLGRSGISGLKTLFSHTWPGWKPPGGVTKSASDTASDVPGTDPPCSPPPLDLAVPAFTAGVACSAASRCAASVTTVAAVGCCVSKGWPMALTSLEDVTTGTAAEGGCWVGGGSSLEAEW